MMTTTLAKTRIRPRGFSMIEALLVLILVAYALSFAMNRWREANAILVDKPVADYHNSVVTYGNRYIRDNYALVAGAATTTTPAIITVPILNAAYGANLATGNRYGQTPCILVLQPSAGVLQPVLVTEGGTDLTPPQQLRIAQRMTAGAIIQTVGGVLTAQGLGTHFAVPLTNFVTRNCSGTAATINRVAANMAYDTNTNRANFLYNTTITGNPNANTMFTNLNMNNNNITNVNTLTATTINATTINTTGNITGACFVDVNDPTFKLCPSAQSNLNNVDMNNVRAAKYSGKTNAAYSVIPDGTSTMKDVVADTVTTSVMYDKDNTAFFIDPAANSNVRNAYVTDRRSDVRLSNFMANFVECATSLPQGDGGSVAACTCLDGGQTSIYLIPQNIKLPADLTLNPKATLSGSNWTITIRDGSNNPVPSTQYFAKLGCYFS